MGQKVHPTGIRLGVVKDHNSVWYADSKTYAKNLINDLEVREYCLLYTSPSPRDRSLSRMPSSA